MVDERAVLEARHGIITAIAADTASLVAAVAADVGESPETVHPVVGRSAASPQQLAAKGGPAPRDPAGDGAFRGSQHGRDLGLRVPVDDVEQQG